MFSNNMCLAFSPPVFGAKTEILEVPKIRGIPFMVFTKKTKEEKIGILVTHSRVYIAILQMYLVYRFTGILLSVPSLTKVCYVILFFIFIVIIHKIHIISVNVMVPFSILIIHRM